MAAAGLAGLGNRLFGALSGGQQRRVLFGLALCGNPELLFFDEPTTGLHFQDVQVLLGVLTRLRDAGNTLIIIEHQLDVIKCADWVLDLGPGGGEAGGRLLAQGTPEEVAAALSPEEWQQVESLEQQAGALTGTRRPAPGARSAPAAPARRRAAPAALRPARPRRAPCRAAPSSCR